MHSFAPYQSAHAQFFCSFRHGNTWREPMILHCTCRRHLRRKEVIVHVRAQRISIPLRYGGIGLRQNRKHSKTRMEGSPETIDEKSSGIKEREGGALIFILCNTFYNVNTKEQKVNNQLWIQRCLFSTSVCSRILSACKCHFIFCFMASISYKLSLFEC